MQYQFNQALKFSFPDKETKQNRDVFFGLGVHEVGEEVESHPHFEQYAKCGYIGEAEGPAQKFESVDERSKRLHDRILARKKPAEAETEAKPEKKSKAKEPKEG